MYDISFVFKFKPCAISILINADINLWSLGAAVDIQFLQFLPFKIPLCRESSPQKLTTQLFNHLLDFKLKSPIRVYLFKTSHCILFLNTLSAILGVA